MENSYCWLPIIWLVSTRVSPSWKRQGGLFFWWLSPSLGVSQSPGAQPSFFPRGQQSSGSDGHRVSHLHICSDCLSKWLRGHRGREFGSAPFSKSSIIGKELNWLFHRNTFFSPLTEWNSQCYQCAQSLERKSLCVTCFYITDIYVRSYSEFRVMLGWMLGLSSVLWWAQCPQ